MSYCCTPFRIDFERLNAIRGSKDDALVHRVAAHLAATAPEIRAASASNPNSWDNARARWKACLEHLVAGTTPEPPLADQYDAVLNSVVGSFQAPLWAVDDSIEPTRHLSDPLSHWKIVTDVIRKRGLADVIPVDRLVASELPVRGRIERKPDHVLFGYFTPENARTARKALSAQDWSGEAPEIRETFEWLSQCVAIAAKEDGYGLVMTTNEKADGGPYISMELLGYDELMAVPGSGDRRLVRREIRSIFGQADDSSPEAVFKPVLKALAAIVKGSRLSPARAPEYVEALNAVCWVLGTAMDNGAVAPAPPAHFDAVDRILTERGIDPQITMSRLVFGGPPLGLPETDDFPAVGYLTPDQVAGAHRALAPQDWSQAPDDLRPTLQQLTAWMQEAGTHHQGIVCFYA